MSARLTSVLFALTTFLSAFLLFQVQPLLSKAILPWFGGSPAVWTVCMLFFQVCLFAGYVYAHVTTRHLPRSVQAALHVVLLIIAACLGPITPAVVWKPGTGDDPTSRILLLLTVCIGLPYFLLSTTGPLLQAWFARTSPGTSPYRLYALSNVGSLLALLSYPFVVEPTFEVTQQGVFWSWGFGLFVLLCAACAILNAKANADSAPADASESSGPSDVNESSVPTRGDRILWLALPMTACVLLIAATNQVCQEVAPMPFLWVVPLALYLLSFILTFDSTRWYLRTVFYGGTLVSAGLSVWMMLLAAKAPTVGALASYFSLLFCSCMVCHGELVRMRPHPKYLTSFYLCLSAGGAAGGLFVGLIAPRIFTDYYEWHGAIFTVIALPLWIFMRDDKCPLFKGRGPWIWTGIMCGVVAVTIGLSSHLQKINATQSDSARNFFGVLKIESSSTMTRMRHGGVLHGSQFRSADQRRLGTTYYSEPSGIGLVLKRHRPAAALKVGLIGLGAGTTAVYGQEGDHFRFYEINPQVEKFARKHFTYLADCPAKLEVVLGDARLQMEQEPPQAYDVLALDAFSGDGVPAHLLTSEAFDIYLKHMKPNGVIAAHVTNRHLDLRPVLLAQAERLGLTMLSLRHNHRTTPAPGATINTWVLLTKNTELLNASGIQAAKIPDSDRKVLWTDGRSDLLAIINGVN